MTFYKGASYKNSETVYCLCKSLGKFKITLINGDDNEFIS